MPTDIVKAVQVQADAYYWRPGSRVKADPDKAIVELRGLYERVGAITPQGVVEAAKLRRSVLHDEFEWNNGEAARLYREDQARHILRSMVVVYRRPDQTMTQPVRAFVKIVPSADDPSLDDVSDDALQPHVYLPIRKVMDEPDLRERIKRQAWRDLVSWRQRYRDISDFARVFELIDQMEAEQANG